MVALGVALHPFQGLAGALGQDLVHAPLDAHDLLGMDHDVRGLSAGAAQGLVNHDLGVGQGPTHALGPCGQQEGAHGGGHADAEGGHGATQVLHGVVNGHAGGHGAAGAVDVKANGLVGVFHFQEEHLRHDQVGGIIVDLAGQEDDPVLEQPGVDVVRSFTPVRLFHHDRYQTHINTLLSLWRFSFV